MQLQLYNYAKNINLNYFYFVSMCCSVHIMKMGSQQFILTLQCYIAQHFFGKFKVSVHTHTHTFNGPLSRTTRVSQYQKGKTNLDFTKARDSEWQWHQLGHMQVCTSLQSNNHASTPPLRFLQAGCPSCRPTNSVKVLKG